jgi:dGTP triphosphohydrolase
MALTKRAPQDPSNGIDGPYAAAANRVEPAAQEERNEVIESLQRALADEQQHAAKLREVADSLRFKAETLEKSYAKQLADVRHRLAAAEQALAAHDAKASAYGADHEETIRLLTGARTELAEITLDRNRLRQQLSHGDRFDRTPLVRDDATLGGGTINQLIANADWARDNEPASASHLEARVASDDETPSADLIPPELVFTRDRDDNEP